MRKLRLWHIYLLVVGLLLLSGWWYLQSTAQPDFVACPMDAKVCPDGSSVGRVPPACEFAPCPEGIVINNDDNEPLANIVCESEPTPALTEGPYYKTGSPERQNLLADEVIGEQIVITGYVLDTDCEPVAGAWLDFWQADGEGNYDLAGYRLRGHQFTDANGRYYLETVRPARYSGRTPHIHVKVRATDMSPVLTTQLFFSGEAENLSDRIFNERLIVRMSDASEFGEINFVLKR